VILIHIGKQIHFCLSGFSLIRTKIQNKFLNPFFLFLLLILCGCIFIPETPEDPVQNSIVDFFNFKQILDTLHYEEAFNFQEYRELFGDGFAYHNISEHTKYSKKEFLDRLKTIELKYSNSATDSIHVVWSFLDTNAIKNEPKVFIDKGKEITLAEKKYLITVISSPNNIKNYSGKSTFKLIFNTELNRWIISYWLDDHDQKEEKSFFSPGSS